MAHSIRHKSSGMVVSVPESLANAVYEKYRVRGDAIYVRMVDTASSRAHELSGTEVQILSKLLAKYGGWRNLDSVLNTAKARVEKNTIWVLATESQKEAYSRAKAKLDAAIEKAVLRVFQNQLKDLARIEAGLTKKAREIPDKIKRTRNSMARIESRMRKLNLIA